MPPSRHKLSLEHRRKVYANYVDLAESSRFQRPPRVSIRLSKPLGFYLGNGSTSGPSRTASPQRKRGASPRRGPIARRGWSTIRPLLDVGLRPQVEPCSRRAATAATKKGDRPSLSPNQPGWAGLVSTRKR